MYLQRYYFILVNAALLFSWALFRTFPVIVHMPTFLFSKFLTLLLLLFWCLHRLKTDLGFVNTNNTNYFNHLAHYLFIVQCLQFESCYIKTNISMYFKCLLLFSLFRNKFDSRNKVKTCYYLYLNKEIDLTNLWKYSNPVRSVKKAGEIRPHSEQLGVG